MGNYTVRAALRRLPPTDSPQPASPHLWQWSGKVSEIQNGWHDPDITIGSGPDIVPSGKSAVKCRHPEIMDPRDGYRFCTQCGESIGRKNRRLIDAICERTWGYRPWGTKP